jgi:hypothetical protein
MRQGMKLDTLLHWIRNQNPDKISRITLSLWAVIFAITYAPSGNDRRYSLLLSYLQEGLVIIFLLSIALYGIYLWVANEQVYKYFSKHRVQYVSRASIIFSGVVCTIIGLAFSFLALWNTLIQMYEK